MLYPTNIKVKRITKMQKIKRKVRALLSGIKKEVKYIIFDRKNFRQRIMSKLHI